MIQGVVRHYVKALATQNGDEACKNLTGDARRALIDSNASVTTCQQAIASAGSGLGAAETHAVEQAPIQVHITGTGAVATFQPQGQNLNTYALVKLSGTWYISNLQG